MSRATRLSNVCHKSLAVIPALAVLALVATSAPSAVTSNRAPVAKFTETTVVIHNLCGFWALFNARRSVAPPGTSITQYAWSFGDGNSLVTTGSGVVHAYRPGSYDVTLTVTDSDGTNASTSRLIWGGSGCP
jgi:PKD repeat protein